MREAAAGAVVAVGGWGRSALSCPTVSGIAFPLIGAIPIILHDHGHSHASKHVGESGDHSFASDPEHGCRFEGMS